MFRTIKLLQNSARSARIFLRNVKTTPEAAAEASKWLSSQRGTRTISMSIPQAQKEELEITFIRANGDRIKAKAKVGDTLLDVVVNNNIDLDGFGACEGTLTCSTCHLILKQEDYDGLPDKPSDEEADMLDLAYDLTDTSRLGCQITLTKDMNGLEVQVPCTVNDARAQP